MRSPLLLLALVASALAAPTPNPGELQPVQPGPDDASWYCQWKRRVIFDRYSLEGKNWGVTERELKKKISSEGSAVSDWSYREDGNGGFKANWNLPISMHHNVEDKLNHLIKPDDVHGIICHDI